MNELQTQMLTIQKTISEMDRLSGQLPVCQSLDQLAGMLEDTNFSPDEPPQFQMESRDARLLAQYLRMAYLDTPVTEYQQFLWQKIMQQTMEHARTDLKMMSRYLQSISRSGLMRRILTSICGTRKSLLSRGRIIRRLWKN